MAATKKASEVTNISLNFIKERETKGTWRYAEEVEDGGDAVVGTLYLKNHAVATLGHPETLTVIIENV